VALIITRPWTRQPPEFAPLNTSAPLFRGLTHYFPLTGQSGASPLNKVGAPGAFGGGPPLPPRACAINGGSGTAVYLNGTTFLSLDGTAEKWLGQSGASASFWIQPQSLANAYTALLSFVKPPSSTDYVSILLKSNGKFAVYVSANGIASSYDGTGANTLAVGDSYRIDFVWAPTKSNCAIWVNGVYDGGFAFAPTTMGNLNSAALYFGQDSNNPDNRRYTGLVSNIILASMPWEYDNSCGPTALYGNGMWSLSTPQRLAIPPAGAAPALPTLTSPTMFQLTATTGYPRVTAS
jgi:Concanavalin A-like lectin/glucanases superfamily